MKMLVLADSKIPHAETAFKQFGKVKVVPTKQMTNETARDADVILIRSETKVDASFLKGTNVSFVGTATIGTDHVDLEYLKQHTIGFASCPGSNANSVAEYVLAALLVVGAQLGITLKGKTFGVVGHGNTGSRAAKKAKAIGMNVLLNDPPLARTTGDSRYVALDALMEADFVSLHVPLTQSGEDATLHLFDERRFSAMKEGSVLINSSRGAVVKTEALKRAFRNKHLQACVLDVWENEPHIDVELLRLVLIGTPHIAGYSYDGKLNAAKMLQQALSGFFHLPISKAAHPDSDEQKEILLPESTNNLESLLRHAVKRCYDVEEDDRKLRKLLSLSESERPERFRRMRAEYLTRREFNNYMIDVTTLDEESRNVLAAVGFTLKDFKDAA